LTFGCSGAQDSVRAPECQKIKSSGLDQYGAEPFEQRQFGTTGVEGVNFFLELPVQLTSVCTKSEPLAD